MRITIPGQTRSKKNSMRIVRFGNRASIRPSKLYDEWQKKALSHLILLPKWTGRYPVNIRFYFFRENDRRFDFSNMVEGAQDVLQQSGILLQDDMRHVFPVIDGYEIDKENPRLELVIEERYILGESFGEIKENSRRK